MKSPRSHNQIAALLIVTAVGFMVSAQSPVFAQGGSRPSSIQRRVERLNRQGEQFERDNLGRNVSDESGKENRRRSHELMARIKKDLEGLQARYNQIVLMMAAHKSADDAQVLHAVVEVNECSTRLKQNLGLPQPKDEKSRAPAPATTTQTDAPLMRLRKHIYSFVMNPLFESPAVLDVEQAKNASRDLDKIIEVSESISKEHAKKKTTH